MRPRTRRPRVRSDRDLGPKFASAERDVIGRLGIEVVRDELVITVDARVSQVKADDAAFVNSTLLDQLDRAPMAFEDRR